MYDKVVNYGSELKDRARSRVRRGSTASQRPAPPPEFLPQPQTLEDALTHLAELQYTSNQHLRNLALAEERLSRVEIEHDILKAEVDRLLSFKEEAKVLGLQVVGLRKAVLESQKDAAAANDNARHADMAREIDARRNDERIRILEGELADVRDKWRWLKQHCGFRETYSGFVGQALHDYSTWEAFWTKATAANSKGAEEGRGSEEFDTWLRFQEEQEDYVRAALKGELAAHRATWEHEMVDERAAFDAQRCEWDTQKACMVENEARLRTQIADMAYEQIQANAAMEVKIDNLTEYLKTSEAEQKRMHADLDAAKEVEDGLRARLAACPDMRELLVANDTELRLRARLETYKEIIEGYETRLQAIVPELKVEKRKHADYRRVAAGLQRENERLRAEARRSAKESEDEFHDTLEIIESHAA
ncbi:hypothetical protein CspeluHIS016_0902760 [Cutaneotrichosporon spelunceum]|uniref:Uncharacterized protein n=1 Tax=Cutaneotrichosporon spelunceum TaxID=1672016 RepID=A0AAD3U034_9TREE|nr:hypothetical protein CspeluHIS016_0902760 [Cutaneotrichosporon spelunceum]